MDIESALNVFRDSIWQFIGAVLTLLALFVAIRGNLLQQRSKRLAYKVEEVLPIIPAQNLPVRLKVMYDEKVLVEPHIVILRIFNTGQLPILPEDYKQPLVISFGESARIIVIGFPLPKLLKDIVLKQISPNEIEIAPSLLNPGDMFNISVLIEPQDQAENADFWIHWAIPNITVDGRIVGVKEVKRLDDEQDESAKLLLLKAGVIFGAYVIVLGIVMIIAIGWLGYEPIPSLLVGILALTINMSVGAILRAYLRIRDNRNSNQNM